MNGEKILWTGRQNMKAALMSAIINFFLLAAAVWLLVNRNNLAETWENLEKGVDAEFSVFMLCLYLALAAIYQGCCMKTASSLWTWKQKKQRRKSRWTKDVETAYITGMTGTQESSPAAMSALTITVFQLAITTAAKTGRKNKKGKEDGRQNN